MPTSKSTSPGARWPAARRTFASVLCALTLFACRESPNEPLPAERPPDFDDPAERNRLGKVLSRMEREAGELAKKVATKSGELSDLSREQVNRFLEELETYRPMLETAGYRMGSVRVRMGLVPAVTVVCTQQRRLAEDERSRVLAEYEQDQLKTLFLKLLFRSDQIELSGYGARAVWVTISLNPHATVILEPVT